MSRERDPYIFAGNLGKKLAMSDIAVETYLVVLDFGLTRSNCSLRRSHARYCLRSGSHGNLSCGLRYGRADLVRIDANFSRSLTRDFRLIQLLNFLLKRLCVNGGGRS